MIRNRHSPRDCLQEISVEYTCNLSHKQSLNMCILDKVYEFFLKSFENLYTMKSFINSAA